MARHPLDRTALAVVEIIDNHQVAQDEVRKLVDTWVRARFRDYKQVRFSDAEEVGEAIRDYALAWFGMAADESNFPGALLHRIVGSIVWTDVGCYYLDDWIEEHDR